MNEIEKLYELAGIEPKRTDECKLADEYWNDEELANKYGTFDRYLRSWCPHNQECTDECKWAYDKFNYSPLTAEKQIKLIKWALRKGCILEVNMEVGSNFYYCPHTKKRFGKFEEALCADVNHHWKFMNLTEQEKIRKILEG